MRITQVDTYLYSLPFDRPITNGLYTYTSTDLTFAQVRTDAGIDGVGFVHGTQIVYAAVRDMAPRIIGTDPWRYENLWAQLYAPKVYGRKGLATRAISCVDIALWDILAKRAEVPLYKMLGGHAPKVPFYVAGGYYETGKGLDELAFELSGYVERLGARAVKMKVGGMPIDDDIDRIRTAREAIGTDVKLLIDANNAYRRHEAAQLMRRAERYDLYWFEEPVGPDDLDGSRFLRDMGLISIAAGENEYTRWGFRDMAMSSAADIWNTDAQVLGGVTEWRKVAAIAQAFDIPIAPHGDQELHVHLVASAPNGLIVEYYDDNTNPLRRKLFGESALVTTGGYVEIGETPGIGVNVDFEKTATLCVAHDRFRDRL